MGADCALHPSDQNLGHSAARVTREKIAGEAGKGNRALSGERGVVRSVFRRDYQADYYRLQTEGAFIGPRA